MANRVIQFSKSQSASSALSNEVYLDISTIAAPIPTPHVVNLPYPQLSSFYDYLCDEKEREHIFDESHKNKIIALSKKSYDEYLEKYKEWKKSLQYAVNEPIFEKYALLLETENNLSDVVTEDNDVKCRKTISLLTDEQYILLYDAWLRYINRPQNKLQKLVNVNAIKNSIHNIFSWTPGERILNPEFGSNLRKLLYEGITDFNQEQIIAEIRHSVSQWEPRVQIDNIVRLTDVDDKENNTVHLRIIYSIPTLTTEQFYYDYDANSPG